MALNLHGESFIKEGEERQHEDRYAHEDGRGVAADVEQRFLPPFDLASDMLFVGGLCPSGPLREAFPQVPFLSLLGATPLIAWFSRVNEVCYINTIGERQCMGGPEPQQPLGESGKAQEGARPLYYELNVIALLRRRAFFVPGIYATSELTIQVGRSQGMPKVRARMGLRLEGNKLRTTTLHRRRRSSVRARLFGSGRPLGRVLSVVWPARVWPAVFPSGSYVRASILSTPRAHPAHVRAGRLSVDAEWLRQPVRLLPFGLYLPGLAMRLPASHRPKTR